MCDHVWFSIVNEKMEHVCFVFVCFALVLWKQHGSVSSVGAECLAPTSELVSLSHSLGFFLGNLMSFFG